MLWRIVGLTFRCGLGQGAVKGTSVCLPGVPNSLERYWKYNTMPPLRARKAGAEGHAELVCDFSLVLRPHCQGRVKKMKVAHILWMMMSGAFRERNFSNGAETTA